MVVLADVADTETALDALRAGASGLLLKPLRATQVLHAFQRCLAHAQQKHEQSAQHPGAAARTAAGDGLVGQSKWAPS